MDGVCVSIFCEPGLWFTENPLSLAALWRRVSETKIWAVYVGRARAVCGGVAYRLKLEVCFGQAQHGTLAP